MSQPLVSSIPAVVVEPASRWTRRGWFLLATLVVGYIGVYLCRKNLSVAIPMLQEHFGASRAEIGAIASVSTLFYAAGKFVFGPVIDRYGGRTCFILSLLGVAIFGGLGAFAGSLGALTILYSFNRLSGSAAWGGMVKLLPDQFGARQLPFAMAVLSLSFVFGGICATLLAGQIAHWSGNNWRAVMGVPSIILLVFVVMAHYALPREESRGTDDGSPRSRGGSPFTLGRFKLLASSRRFWIVLALSFVLTLFRETFNTWTVDFIKTEGGDDVSNRVAAFLSTPFDAFGALGILMLGWVFGRIQPTTRSALLFVMLGLLAVLLWFLPRFFHHGLLVVSVAIGCIGFLSYGPYSLLAGILAVEIRGPAYVATVAGLADGVGYLAGVLAGQQFGLLVDHGGYHLGFRALAGLAMFSAVLCLFLYYPKTENSHDYQSAT